MRHFAHNIGDYAAATAHLSLLEDAAYHRCLRLYYQTEKPLPPDLATVTRLVGARTRQEREAVANVLSEFFEIEPDGYHQKRCDREITVYQEKAHAARRNGTKGGRPSNQKKTETVPPLVQSEKLTTPHSPLPTPVSEANASGAKAPRDVLFAEALPWLIRKTEKSRDGCAKLIVAWCKQVGDDKTLELLTACESENPVDPVSWMGARMKPRETWNDRRRRENLAIIEAYDDRH